MAKVDNLRRLTLEGLDEDQRAIVERISNITNFHLEQIINTLNGNVDEENSFKDFRTIEVTVDANGTPINITDFRSVTGVKGISVIRATNITTPTNFPTSQPFISFSAIRGEVYRVLNITGLRANEKFQLLIELTPLG